MKKYVPYRNIRKRALVMGLSITLFAFMMLSVIGSLLVVIFSFDFKVIIGLLLFNAALYLTLVKITGNPRLLHFKKAFPKAISNKRTSLFSYED